MAGFKTAAGLSALGGNLGGGWMVTPVEPDDDAAEVVRAAGEVDAA